MNILLRKKPTLKQNISKKISQVLPTKKKPTLWEKSITLIQTGGLFIALFLAGFLVAKLHSIMTLGA